MFGSSFDDTVKAALNELAALRIKNLDAKVEGKVVTLTGEAPDMATKARAMQIFNSKVETENTVNMIRIAAPAAAAAPTPVAAATVAPAAPAVTRAEGAAAATTARLHEVAKGDTLSAISKKYYGSANQYMKIFEANKDQLKDPDHIYPGQKLRIP